MNDAGRGAGRSCAWGKRCLLLLSKQDNCGTFEEAQYLIDRKNSYHRMTRLVRVPRSRGIVCELNNWHHETLLDGELVEDRDSSGRKRLIYMVFDCLLINGTNLTNFGFQTRYRHLVVDVFGPYNEFAKARPSTSLLQPFFMRLKDWKPLSDLSTTFAHIREKKSLASDGIIFIPKNEPYVSGTDNRTIKWKEPTDLTVDFQLQRHRARDGNGESALDSANKKQQDYDLFARYGNCNYKFYASLFLEDSTRHALHHAWKNSRSRIIECFFDPEILGWKPKLAENGTPRFWDDKNHANHISVVQDVEESIRDVIDEHELINRRGRLPSVRILRRR